MNAAASHVVSPEDLLAMPDGKHYELVDGELVGRDASSLSSWVGGQLVFRLHEFARDHGSGTVWMAGLGIQCFPHDPGMVRRPKASFVARERFAIGQLGDGFLRIVPDLVVEVISPNDLANYVERKVEEYLGAGVRLVWVVDPDTRTIRIHRGDGSAARLRHDGELSGEDVLPGFLCPVRDLFPPAA